MEMALVNTGIVIFFFINLVALVTRTGRNRPLGLPQLPIYFGFVFTSPSMTGSPSGLIR